MKIAMDSSEFMGYVEHVNPKYIQVYVVQVKKEVAEEKIKLGDYLMVKGLHSNFLGKVLEITLSSKEEVLNKEAIFNQNNFLLTIKAEMMLGFSNKEDTMPRRGLVSYPSIGDKVYYLAKAMIHQFFNRFGLKANKASAYINFGQTTDQLNIPIRLSQQSLLSRHCAVIGTTGGGKSWTLAKIIGEMKCVASTKVILIDPIGEYKQITDEHFDSVEIGKDSFFHYRHLTTEDLYYLLKPSNNIQMPKLLEAIRSLKSLELDVNNDLYTYAKKGIIRKANRKKESYETFYFDHIDQIEDGILNFNIKHLASQITQECIYDTDKNHPEKYGNRNEEAVSKCFNLISRTSNLLHTEVFKRAFGFDEEVGTSREMTQIIEKFMISDKQVLRIGFEGVGFEFQAREIIANAIGKYLLVKARENKFKEKPLVVCIDEAHQFMNKTVVDDFQKGSSLTAFDQVAKECRKYGLFLCIATQMPRDIPVGTLSQMGTFIVHRLINYNDKQAIAEACTSATSNVLDFLPILGEGEAILSGVDFPMDITVKVTPPILKPGSETPILGKESIEQ